MRRPLALALLALLGVSWGVHVSLSKALDAQDNKTALAYLTIYMAGTAIGLSALQAAARRPFRFRRAHLRFLVIAAFLGYFAPLLTEIIVAPKIDVSLFALVGALYPAMTLAIAAAIRLERVTLRRFVALTLGLAASVVLLAPDVALSSEAATLWVLLAFCAPMAYALDNVYVASAWPSDLDTLQVSAAEAAVGLAMCLVISLFTGVDAGAVSGAMESGGIWLWALIFVSMAGTWLYFELLRTAGAVFVSFGGFISLATGILSGVIFFAERPTLGLWVACALTVASLMLLRSAAAEEGAPAAG